MEEAKHEQDLRKEDEEHANEDGGGLWIVNRFRGRQIGCGISSKAEEAEEVVLDGIFDHGPAKTDD